MKRSSETALVTTVELSADGGARRRPDQLAVEEPLTIQLDNGRTTTTVATTMRTPGDDFDLAVGFLHAEGMLGGATVTSVRYCATAAASATEFNVVTVTAPGAPEPTPRLGTTSTSCGLCGSEAIDTLAERLDALPGTFPLDRDTLDLVASIPDRVRERQELFIRTGAVHAAASVDLNGQIDLVREDVGRHNAVDKVVGHELLERRLPASGRVLFVSGRASFELVMKAWAAGFGCLLAVSAPTELAVRTARRAGLALVGFARGSTLNVYAPERIA